MWAFLSCMVSVRPSGIQPSLRHYKEDNYCSVHKKCSLRTFLKTTRCVAFSWNLSIPYRFHLADSSSFFMQDTHNLYQYMNFMFNNKLTAST